MTHEETESLLRPWMKFGPLAIPHRRPGFKSLVRLVGGVKTRLPIELKRLRLDDLLPTQGRRTGVRCFELWRGGPEPCNTQARLNLLRSIYREPADYAEFVAFNRAHIDLRGIPMRIFAHRAGFRIDGELYVLCHERAYRDLEMTTRIELHQFDTRLRGANLFLMTFPPEYAHMRLPRP